MASIAQKEISSFFEILGSGEPERLRELFAGSPLLDVPLAGRVEGVRALGEFTARYHEWLRGSHTDFVALTGTADRSVAEFIVHLNRDGEEIPLPVAAVADKTGDAVAAVRVYYSMWPLLDHHVVRPPVLCKDESLTLPDIVDMYHCELTNGDLEGILDVFEDDGYAREPSGGPYIYKGYKELQKFYGLIFSNGGGVLLDHCLLTDDGIRAALEYNAIRWGKTDLPPQAGIAVFERSPPGLLHAARIYDDVELPV